MTDPIQELIALDYTARVAEKLGLEPPTRTINGHLVQAKARWMDHNGGTGGYRIYWRLDGKKMSYADVRDTVQSIAEEFA